jgi:predicted aspartyl protease
MALLRAATLWEQAFVAIAMFIPAAACTQHTRAPPSGSELSAADRLFSAAQFVEAGERYLAVENAHPRNFRACLRLGEIALLGNRLDEAERWLLQASTVDPSNNDSKRLLAEAYYRLRAFDKSARYLRLAGSDVVASKLEHFASKLPYQVDGPEETQVKFVSTDPLPLIRVRVNGSTEVNFLIDTGAPEIVLDREFAKQVAAIEFGSSSGTFAGDNKAEVIQGAVESIRIGGWLVRHVPVHLLPTRRFSGILGRRVDGIVGTRFLYQFISTIDYPKGELALRQVKNGDSHRPQSEPDAAALAVPFWLAGDHYLLAPGTVNGNPTLLFVDTGLAGMGFTAPASTLKAAGIAVQQGQVVEGLGGGGKVSASRFNVGELALGSAVARNVPGLAGIFPASLENKFGFRIGGLISHAFFRSYSLTIDFSRMRLYLRPSRA